MRVIVRLGDKLMRQVLESASFTRFCLEMLALLLERRGYQPIVLENLVKQVYFTAVQPLGVFSLYTAILALSIVSITVSLAGTYGLEAYRLNLIANLLMAEVMPLMTALFVALRSGAAINAEMALMALNRENEALAAYGVDVRIFEWLPRVMGGVLAVLLLTLFGNLLVLLAAYLVLYDWRMGHLISYIGELAAAFNPLQLLLVAVKSIAFGLWITLIPIYMGQGAHAQPMVPIVVLKGMMRVFLALLATEVVLLSLTYL